jgi:hypothetical protein
MFTPRAFLVAIQKGKGPFPFDAWQVGMTFRENPGSLCRGRRLPSEHVRECRREQQCEREKTDEQGRARIPADLYRSPCDFHSIETALLPLRLRKNRVGVENESGRAIFARPVMMLYE